MHLQTLYNTGTQQEMCLCLALQELNELVQTIINTRESIKGTTVDDDLFSEPNDASKDLLRSIQFTLQVTLFYQYNTVWLGNALILGDHCNGDDAIFNSCCKILYYQD